jgi:tetratricopeptide (TPR) repeat protein
VVWKPIEPLPSEDALRLLTRLTDAELPEDLSALKTISGILSGFTMAVELVGRLLAAEKAERGVPYQATAEALRSQIVESLDEVSTTYGKQLFRCAPEAEISTVVHRAVDRLSSVNFKVLGLLSQLAPNNAPLVVVKEALAVAMPEFQGIRRFHLEIVFAMAIENLMSLRLASRPDKPGASSIPVRELVLDSKISLTVHPLVQAVVRRNPESRDLCQAICDVLFRQAREVAGHTSHPEHQWFLAATDAIAHSWLDRAAAGETNLAPAACEIGFAAGSGLLGAGRWSEAASVLGRVVKLEKSELMEEHPGMAMTHNALAVALSEMGRPNEAVTHLEIAIGISGQFGDLETEGRLRNSLASLTIQKDVPTRRRDARADEKTSEAPLDAARLSALATQAAEEGDLSRAYETFVRSLALLDDSDPEADAAFVRVSTSLGIIASQQGRWDVAEKHLRDAVKHGRSTLHLGDPRLLEARRSLARCLWDRGVSRDEVIQILRESLSDLQGREAEQPEIACDLLHELGLKLAALGLLEEGLERLSEAARVAREYLGPDHRKVMLSLNNLGYAHLEGNRPKQALPFLLEAAGKILGSEDARLAAIIAGNIGKAYLRAGEPRSSATYLERAIAAGDNSVEVANRVEWRFLLAEALAFSDQPTRAANVLREQLGLLETLGEARGRLFARASGNLAQLLGAFDGPSDEVVLHVQNAISIWDSMNPVPISELAQDLFVLGTTRAMRQELPEAEDALEKALGHYFVMSFEAEQQHPLLEQVAGMFAWVVQQQGFENAEAQKRIRDVREWATRMRVGRQP